MFLSSLFSSLFCFFFLSLSFPRFSLFPALGGVFGRRRGLATVLKASGSAGDMADRDGTLRAISFSPFYQEQGMDAFSLGFFFSPASSSIISFGGGLGLRGESGISVVSFFSLGCQCLLPSSIIILDLRFSGIEALARRGLVVVAGYWAHKRGVGGRDAAKR